jgi:murein DD-endopeptidase MepM/ murein hydrolase activator NlpD
MSSLHQDRLLVVGSGPATGSASTLETARGTSRRPAEKKATNTVPTQRQGTAQRSGSTKITVDGAVPAVRTRRSAGAKTAAAASGAAGTLASRAKAATNATAKIASGKAATVTTATAKATTAKVAAAKAARAKAATAKPTAAKPTAAKSTAATAVPAKASAAAKAAPAATTAPTTATPSVQTPTVRPTPHKRTAPLTDVIAPVADPLADPVDVAMEVPVVGAVAAGRRRGFLRRRPPSIGRRPALYLAAALIGATSLSAVTPGELAAPATETASQSVSVAQELGIRATPTQAITDTDAAELLGDLAASRNVRGAEQAAAAQVQAEADRVAAEAAAEAARPKAVRPVEGGRLTSGFGARWGTLHAGIDLAAPMQTPEYAAMDGVVLEAGPASGYGLAVYIQHENGDVTVYGHMDSILVEAGQVVRAGDTIALLGNRGQSTGPHLHFEVHVGGINGEKIDPLPWLRDKGVEI